VVNSEALRLLKLHLLEHLYQATGLIQQCLSLFVTKSKTVNIGQLNIYSLSYLFQIFYAIFLTYFQFYISNLNRFQQLNYSQKIQRCSYK
jgi:hypothetical protein